MSVFFNRIRIRNGCPDPGHGLRPGRCTLPLPFRGRRRPGNRPGSLRYMHHGPVPVQSDKPGLFYATEPEQPAGEVYPELVGDPGANERDAG